MNKNWADGHQHNFPELISRSTSAHRMTSSRLTTPSTGPSISDVFRLNLTCLFAYPNGYFGSQSQTKKLLILLTPANQQMCSLWHIRLDLPFR